jgi:outer membrane protein assembly factor BamB
MILLVSESLFIVANFSSNSLTSDYDELAEPNLQLPDIDSHKVTSDEISKLKCAEGVSNKSKDSSQTKTGFQADVSPPTEEEWSNISLNAYMADSIRLQGSLPSSYDNSKSTWFPPIGIQGHGCNAFSVGYYTKTFLEAKEHGWDLSGAKWETSASSTVGCPTTSYQDKIMSPAFIYNLCNPSGSLESTIGVVLNVGVCSWKTMPYVGADYTLWPSEEAWTEAAYYRGNYSTGYQYIDLTTDAGLTNLKNWLASQNLASIYVDGGHKLDSSILTSNDLFTLDNYGGYQIDHVNTVVGYDDSISYTENGQTRYGGFKVANSWGVGGWENIPDGYYWISYEAMKQYFKTCMFYYDLIDYHPDIMASFRILHDKRSDCSITVGIGNSNGPVVTKYFSGFVSSYPYPYSSNDYLAFPDNNIVLDLTELKSYFTSSSQTFWLSVYDQYSSETGAITSFAVNCSGACIQSTQTPCLTQNNQEVSVSVTYPAASSFTIFPNAGPAGSLIALNASGLTAGGTASISYLTPNNNQWFTINNNRDVSSSGTIRYYSVIPELLKTNPSGDNPAQSDTIIFRVSDNTAPISFNASVREMRRGLIRVGDRLASGLYGNNTDLSTQVTVNSGETMALAGCWFMSGDISIQWDDISISNSVPVDRCGGFSLLFKVPEATINGTHIIKLTNANAVFYIKVNAIKQPVSPLFTVANNDLCVVLPGFITSLYAKTGEFHWQKGTSVKVNCTVAYNNVLYLGSADGLYAMDTGTKQYLWILNHQYTKNIFALAAADGVVYESTSDGIFMAISSTGQFNSGDTGSYGSNAGGVTIQNGKVYLALKDGRLRAYSIPSSYLVWGSNTYGGSESWSSVAAYENLLHAVSKTKIYAFNSNNGDVIWSVDLANFGASNSKFSSISEHGGRVFACVGGQLFSLNAGNGAFLSKADYGSVSCMAAGSYVIYLGVGNQVKAVNVGSSDTQPIIWSYPTNGQISNVAYSDGLLYASSTDGGLYAINASNGQKVWDYLGTQYTPTTSPSPSPTTTPTTTPSNSETTPQNTNLSSPTPTSVIPEYSPTLLILIMLPVLSIAFLLISRRGNQKV